MYYEIFRTYYVDYNLNENQCHNKEIDQEPTVRGCIENYINAELACNIPWSMSKDGRKQDCEANEKFQQYQSLGTKLASMNSREMGKKTGCIRRCKRMAYKLRERSPIGSKTKYPPELVKLTFIISTGKGNNKFEIDNLLSIMFTGEYEKKEHYFIYDGNHLIADVGGYLGLLLGFSIYSIFKSSVESLARKRVFSLFSKTDKGKISPTGNARSLPGIIPHHHSSRNREMVPV